MFRRILVPLDGSRFSARALPYATSIAKQFKAQIVLLRVLTESMQDIASAAPTRGGPTIHEMFLKEAQQMDKRKRRVFQRYLRRKLREMAAQGVDGSYRIASGNVAAAINDSCTREDIDLVVMTTRGRGGFKRAVLGSVADEVIRGCDVPVLVVKPQRR